MKKKLTNPWGVRCDICNYEWYKGAPMTDEELKEHSCIHASPKIQKIKIDQATHGGSVYINDMTFGTYDKPVKILGDKINEIIDYLNKAKQG